MNFKCRRVGEEEIDVGVGRKKAGNEGVRERKGKKEFSAGFMANFTNLWIFMEIYY